MDLGSCIGGMCSRSPSAKQLRNEFEVLLPRNLSPFCSSPTIARPSSVTSQAYSLTLNREGWTADKGAPRICPRRLVAAEPSMSHLHSRNACEERDQGMVSLTAPAVVAAAEGAACKYATRSALNSKLCWMQFQKADLKRFSRLAALSESCRVQKVLHMPVIAGTRRCGGPKLCSRINPLS